MTVAFYPKLKSMAERLLEEGIKIGDEIIIDGNTTYSTSKSST